MADQRTRLVRIHEDLANMLSDIVDVTDETISDIIDPLIRPAVEERHARLKSAIRAIKAARAKHQPIPVELGGEAGGA